MSDRETKAEIVQKLKTLLDVPGAKTRWEAVEHRLMQVPLMELNALHYRVERAIEIAHQEGERFGRTDEFSKAEGT